MDNDLVSKDAKVKSHKQNLKLFYFMLSTNYVRIYFENSSLTVPICGIWPNIMCVNIM